MATYNGMGYLKEQLDSIAKQSLPADEVIIRDDGSTDGTVQFVRGYIQDNHLDNWTIETNGNNLGYKRTFTLLIHEASNDVIFLCDQDDIWEKDKIKVMLSTMEENSSILLLASDLSVLYMSENAPKVNYERIGKHIEKIGFCSKWVKPVRPGCCFAIRRELIPDYDSFWTEDIPHDCALWNVASLHDASYCISDKLIRYRRHEQNASNLGAHDLNYRIASIEQEIRLMDRAILNMSEESQKKFLSRQRQVYTERVAALRRRHLLTIMRLGFQWRYYGRARYALTDVLYCLRGKFA